MDANGKETTMSLSVETLTRCRMTLKAIRRIEQCREHVRLSNTPNNGYCNINYYDPEEEMRLRIWHGDDMED